MRTITRVRSLCAAAAIVLLAGCSGGSAIAPGTESTQTSSHARVGHVISRYTCSATGSLRYVSDVINNVINIYGGRFAGQPPCGQISSSLDGPLGLHVDFATHDLYVANSRAGNILVYHRGQLTPYNTYTDPSGQSPSDVTIAPDGTVVASNEFCSLSTWIEGPNGGTFVGTFSKPQCRDVGIVFVAAGENGTLYYVNARTGAHRASLWSVSCPGGNCGVPVQIPGARVDYFGSGVAVDSVGSVLAVKLSTNGGNNKLATFNLPNPTPRLMDLSPGFPYGIAINDQDHLLFVANNTGASEYTYPSGKLLGTVPANPGGAMDGIAIDPQFSPR
jgi:DNA-binding beta-propeller fold protein YncE